MLFEELGKLKRSSIMTSIIFMAVGIVMIMCPAQYVNSLVSVLGYAMEILATVWILDFLSSKKCLMDYIYLTGALILMLLGMAVLVLDNVVLYIGIIFGLVQVVSGVVNLINAWMYARRAQRKGWWVLVVLSVLVILSGLTVLVNPWWNEPTKLFDVIGVMLLFSSVVSIVRTIFNWPIKGE